MTDNDECESGTGRDICPRSSVCVNTNGSYDCICINGTQMDESGNCSGIIIMMYYVIVEVELHHNFY